MTQPLTRPEGPLDDPRVVRTGLVGVSVVVALLLVGLLWAKWLPYGAKVGDLLDTRTWPGTDIFRSSGEPGSTPSLAGAWDFWTAYFAAVWKAALVALVVAAALESLVPRAWLVRVLDRRTLVGQGAAGGLLSAPSMMCSCCTAPVAVGLRRSGAPLGASLAYWIGNPLLNPAVLVFLALTLPWQVTAVRVVVGVALVVGGSALVAAWVGRAPEPAPPGREVAPPTSVRELPGRFVRTLGRYLLVLVPEYAVVVLLTGLLSGWLSDFAGLDGAAGPLALLAVALVAVVLVIPTGGEIPVVVGLLAAGASTGVAGVLLVALPALSLPSVVMVGRTLTWRATLALAGVVTVGAVGSGLLLTALG